MKVERSTKGGSRDAIRVYLGTIPNYASEDVKGVLLSGVRGGAPADKAGLKAGDIIVRFAGKDIELAAAETVGSQKSLWVALILSDMKS